MELNLCLACNKEYKTSKNLNEHYENNKLCKKWIDILNQKRETFDKKLILNIQSIHTRVNPVITDECMCVSCHKSFSNVGNLNKHINKSIICQKWKDYHTVQKREEYSLEKDNLETDNRTFKFEPLKFVDMHHIIWNVFITDKQTKLISTDITENKINHIIAIFPQKTIDDIDNISLFNILKDKKITYDIMKYNYNDENYVNIDEFEKMCKKIETYRKDRSNILLLCNNGYQRSIPFLCYYLVKYHKDEVSDIAAALDIILPQLDRENYLKTKEEFVESLKSLNFL